MTLQDKAQKRPRPQPLPTPVEIQIAIYREIEKVEDDGIPIPVRVFSAIARGIAAANKAHADG